jgi:hypothetical protein
MTERHYHGTTHLGRLHIDEEAIWPPVSKQLAPINPIDRIRAQIKQEQDFIEKHPNYSTLCEEAQERIIFLQSELDALSDPEALDPVAAKESDAIQAQLSKSWDSIQLIQF